MCGYKISSEVEKSSCNERLKGSEKKINEIIACNNYFLLY